MSRADEIAVTYILEPHGDSTGAKRAAVEIQALVDAALDNERQECARLVHERLGADGHGVAQMIRARGNQST